MEINRSDILQWWNIRDILCWRNLWRLISSCKFGDISFNWRQNTFIHGDPPYRYGVALIVVPCFSKVFQKMQQVTWKLLILNHLMIVSARLTFHGEVDIPRIGTDSDMDAESFIETEEYVECPIVHQNSLVVWYGRKVG